MDPDELTNQIKTSDRDTVIYKILPQAFGELIHSYFRVTVSGAEHLPKSGRAIVLPNHSGVSGFDAMVLQHEIHKASERTPRVLTHPLWFMTRTTSVPAQRLGFIKASTENGLHYLERDDMIMLFPEGETGNFKPSTEAYQLQEFKRGFVRMALTTGAPVVPTLIIGAEETHVNLSRLKLSKWIRGLVLPLPLNLIPLPSKWRIVFMEAVTFPFKPDAANDRDLVHELAADLQEKMQIRLASELEARDSAFL